MENNFLFTSDLYSLEGILNISMNLEILSSLFLSCHLQSFQSLAETSGNHSILNRSELLEISSEEGLDSIWLLISWDILGGSDVMLSDMTIIL